MIKLMINGQIKRTSQLLLAHTDSKRLSLRYLAASSNAAAFWIECLITLTTEPRFRSIYGSFDFKARRSWFVVSGICLACFNKDKSRKNERE